MRLVTYLKAKMKYRGVEITSDSDSLTLNGIKYCIGAYLEIKPVGDMLIIVKEKCTLEVNLRTFAIKLLPYSGQLVVSDKFHRNYAIRLASGEYRMFPTGEVLQETESLAWTEHGWVSLNGQLLPPDVIKVATPDGLLI